MSNADNKTLTIFAKNVLNDNLEKITIANEQEMADFFKIPIPENGFSDVVTTFKNNNYVVFYIVNNNKEIEYKITEEKMKLLVEEVLLEIKEKKEREELAQNEKAESLSDDLLNSDPEFSSLYLETEQSMEQKVDVKDIAVKTMLKKDQIPDINKRGKDYSHIDMMYPVKKIISDEKGKEANKTNATKKINNKKLTSKKGFSSKAVFVPVIAVISLGVFYTAHNANTQKGTNIQTAFNDKIVSSNFSNHSVLKSALEVPKETPKKENIPVPENKNNKVVDNIKEVIRKNEQKEQDAHNDSHNVSTLFNSGKTEMPN